MNFSGSARNSQKRRLISKFASFVMLFLSTLFTYTNGKKITDFVGSKKIESRRRISIDKCITDLYDATSEYDGNFTQDAYLEFINLTSGGQVDMDKFDVSIIGLVHIFWIVTCSISVETCIGGEETVSLEEILNYESDDFESGSLITEFCNRVDYTLGEIFTSNPSSSPSLPYGHVPSPNTISPNTRPTRNPVPAPTTSPTETTSSSPTINPTYHPTSSPSMDPTLQPSRFLSLFPSNGPSPSPISNSPTLVITSYPSPVPSVTEDVDSTSISFSVVFSVENIFEVVEEWASSIVESVIKTYVPTCEFINGSGGNGDLCIYEYDIDPVFLESECYDEGATVGDRCGLLTVGIIISSADGFIDENIAPEIFQELKLSVDNLDELINPS